MTSILPSVIAHLNNDADVVSTFGHRITAERIPDDQAYPNGRIWTVSTPYQYHLLGASNRRAVLQVDLYGETQSTLDAGLDAVRSALSGFRGQVGDLDVGYCFVKTVSTDWDTDTRTYHRILEVELGTND